MANRTKLGHESTPIEGRHGKKGYVVLRAEVHPDVKDDLLRIANDNKVTLISVIRDALDFYLNSQT